MASTFDLYNRQLHPEEALILEKILALKDDAERRRWSAAACASVGCANGVPQSDPLYKALHVLQQEGEQHVLERSILKEQGFNDYTSLERFDDKRRAHNELIMRVIGVTSTVIGSGSAVTSVGAGAILCTTGVGCSVGAPLAAVGGDAGYELAKQGMEMATRPYQSTEGERVLDSFDPNREAEGLKLSQDVALIGTLGLQATVAGGLGKILGAGVKAGVKVQEKATGNVAKIETLTVKGGDFSRELISITQSQLDKKFKHASDFGIITTKKNPETLAQFLTAIKNHMSSPSTMEQGTYGLVKDSKVFFNTATNNAIVVDSTGNFVTGFKLYPGTQQFENFMKNGILR